MFWALSAGFPTVLLLKVSSLPENWNIPDWAKDELIRHVIGEGVPPLLIKKLVEPIKEYTNGENYFHS